MLKTPRAIPMPTGAATVARSTRPPRSPAGSPAFARRPAERASLIPETSAIPSAPAAPVQVLIALMHSPLAERVRAYLGRTAEFSVAIAGADRVPSPHIVILDFSPESGVPVIHGASSARPIALSAASDDDAFLAALQGGAWALLPARPSPFEVTATVRQVAGGECPILAQIARRPSLAATTLGRLRASTLQPNPLSAREAVILSQVARGAKNGVIGALLGIREQTVKNYLSEILKKTGTGNRAEAAALAVRHGWLDTN